MNFIKRFFATALLAMSVVCASRAADIPIFPTGPVFKFGPVFWGLVGPTGIQNNFFFTPLSPNESVCAYVKNNAAASHLFSLQILTTPDPSNSTPADGTWSIIGNAFSRFSGTSPSQSLGIGVNISGASQVALSFTGTTGPTTDTANVIVVQTQGNCSSGSNFLGNSPQSVIAIPMIQGAAESLAQSYAASNSLTNPASGAVILSTNINNSQLRSAYPDRIVISASVATTVNINQISSLGATCSVATTISLNTIGPGSQTSSQFSCTTPPTVLSTPFPSISIPAGVVSIDLRGFIWNLNSLNGIDVTMAAALTGVISVTLFWNEK